jgi:hypothetical protein
MEEDPKDLHRLGRAFSLGLSLAEQVHGIRRGPGPREDRSEAIVAVLRGLASGYPESAKGRLPETLDEPRRQQREMAGLILRSMLGAGGRGDESPADSAAEVPPGDPPEEPPVSPGRDAG